MANILIFYSTTDGHTRRICQQLQTVIEQQSHRVTLLPIEEWPHTDLSGFAKIVVGASIRYGKHSALVVDFGDKNKSLLDSKANAFFTVNVVARKPEKNRPDTNPYMLKFLTKTSWKPKQLAVFAGKIDYQKYDFIDRMVIRFIMWLTKGPTNTDGVFEFTDWQQVDDFGRTISRM